MKNIRIAFIALIALLLAFVTVSCSDDAMGNNEPTSLTLSKTLIEYDSFSSIGDSVIELTASVALKGGGTSTDVKWVLPDDVSLYTLQTNSNGRLTFKINKPGTWTIEADAYYKGKIVKTAFCVVNVKGYVTALNIQNAATRTTFASGSPVSMYTGATMILAPVYTPASTSQTAVSWSVSNDCVVLTPDTASQQATITAAKAGKVTITMASADNPSILATLNVTVNESGTAQTTAPVSITMNPSGTQNIGIGRQTTVTATVLDGFGHEDSEAEIIWSSGDTSILSASPTGNRSVRVSGLKTGVTTLTATLKNNGNISSKVYFDVTGGIQAISPAAQSYNLSVGDTEDVAVSYAPADTTQTGFTAVSSDPKVATVSVSSQNSIKITAVANGTCEIRITSTKDKNVAADPIYITVSEPVSEAQRVRSISLDSTSITIDPEYTDREVEATVLMRDLEGRVYEDENQEVAWVSSDTSVATVSSIGRVATIKAVAPGVCQITASSTVNPTVKASVLVTVTGALTSLLPDTEQLNIATGATATFTFSPNPANAVFSAPEITVSPSSGTISAIATKMPSGSYSVTVTGLAAGNAVVRARVDGKEYFSVPVTVTSAKAITVYGLELSDYNISMAQDGESQVITARLLDIDGNEMTGKLKWTPDAQASNIISMVTSGNSLIISPKNAGVATILVSTPDNELLSARLRVEVGGSAVQGTNLRTLMTPVSSISIPMGQSEEVGVVYIPADTKQTGLVWKIADASIATISGDDSRVVITPKKVGKTTVTATSSVNERISTSFEVNVTEDAGATDTSISYIKVFSGDKEVTYMSHTKLNEVATLTAKAYTADGRQVDGGIVFTVSGDAIVQYAGGSGSVSYRTAAFGGNQPAYITATAEDNPDASAQVSVYVTPTTSPVTGRIDTAYSAVTILTDGSMEIPLERQSCTDVISWSANDSCISWAENESGNIVVTGLSAGQATLTGRYQTGIISIKVLVVDEVKTIDNSVIRIELDRSYLSYDLNSKAAQVITASVIRADGKADPNEKVVWSVEDEEIATVMAAGLKATVAHGSTLGLTRIKAVSVSNPAAEAYCVVEVVDSSVVPETIRNITLNSTSVTMEPGNQKKLTYTIAPSAFQDSQIRWTTDNAFVATVDGGTVTAIGAGTATITAKVVGTDIQDTCTVNVINREIAQPDAYRIEFNTNVMYLSQDDMDIYSEITAAVYDTTGNKMVADVDWEVNGNEEGIIRFTESHNRLLVTPLSAGTVSVTAKHENVTNTMLVVVGAPGQAAGKLSSIVAQPSRLVVRVGSTAEITAYGVPGGSLKDAVWSISDGTVAGLSANGNTAAITGLAAGSATVTVMSESNPTIKTSVQVTVQKSTAGKITSIELDKRQLSFDLASKSLTELNAKVYVDGSLNTTTPITWTVEGWTGEEEETPVLTPTSSSYRNVLVNYSGKGTGYIKAASSDGDVYALCLISVIDSSDISLKALELSPSAIQIRVGEFAQIRLEDFPRGTSENAEWTIENPDIAEMIIASDGKSVTIRGLVTGETSLRVTDGEISSDNAFIKVLENDETGIINKVVLDKSAIMLDMAREELSTVTATVYIDGIMDPAAEVTFSLVDPEGAPVGFLQNGNTAILSKLETGEAVLRATITGSTSKGVEQTLWSDCYVYVIDSTSPAENPTYTELASIVLNQRNLLLSRGESYLLTASIVPENARDVELEWSSDNPEIATVSADGLVTGRAAGQTIIRVSDVNTGINASCSVTVSGDAVRGVAQILLVPYSINLQQDDDEPKTITARVLDEDGNELSATVTWDVEPILGIADVTIDGNTLSLLPLSAGSGYVKASCSGYSAKALVTTGEEKTIVTDSPLSRISISPASVALVAGNTQLLTASDHPAGKATDITWESDDESVASITPTSDRMRVYVRAENVPAKANTIITARQGDVYGNTEITVFPEGTTGLMTKVELDRTSMVLDLDAKSFAFVNATVYVDGEADPSKTVTWTVIDAAGNVVEDPIATIVTNGNRIGVEKQDQTGEFFLRATATGELNSVYTDCYVSIVRSGEIVAPLSSILLSESSFTLAPGASRRITATAVPSTYQLSLAWGSSNTDVATVNGEGVVTALTEGTTIITATDILGVSSSCTVTVAAVSASTVARNITLSPYTVTLSQEEEDRTATIVANVIGSDNLPMPVTVSWDMTDVLDIVSVEIDGNSVTIAPMNSGSGNITARFGSVSATAHVVVGAPEAVTDSSLKSLSLNPASLQLRVGTAEYVEAEDYPLGTARDIQWLVDDDDIVSFIPTGDDMAKYVAGAAEGTTFIYVKDGDISSKNTTVRVYAKDETGIINRVELDKTAITLDMAQKALTTVTATVYVDGKADPDREVVFSLVGEEEPVSFRQNGNTAIITKLAEGECVLRATATGLTSSEIEQTVYSDCYINVIDSSTIEPVVNRLILSESVFTLRKGETRTISWTAIPNVEGTIVTFESSDLSVAEVSNDGRVDAIAAGTATITARVVGSDISATAELTVYENTVVPQPDPDNPNAVVNAARIELSRTTIVVSMENSMTSEPLTATVYDGDGNEISAQVAWDISDVRNIAAVSISGNTADIFPKNAGRGVISASVTNANGTTVSSGALVEVGVAGLSLTSLDFDVSQPMYMVLGDTKEVGVMYNPDITEMHGVTWGDSAYFDMRKYSDSVMLTATELTGDTGTKVSATSNYDPSKKADLTVIVKATVEEIPQAASIELSEHSITYNLAAKDLNIITATVRDYDGNVVDLPVTWTLTGDSNVANLTELSNGRAGISKGTRTGSAILTATCGEVSARCAITTVDYSEVQSISISSRSVVMNVGEQLDLTFEVLATGYFETYDLDRVTWTSDDYSQSVVELVSEGDGFSRSVVAVGPGTATITLRVVEGSEEFIDQCVVTVLAEPTTVLSSIVISPNVQNIRKGFQGVPLVLRGFDQNGNEMKNLRVRWYDDNQAIAYISDTYTGTGINAGLAMADVVGNAEGTTKIFAMVGGLSAEASVNVYTPTVPYVEPEELLSLNAAMNSIKMKKGTLRHIEISPNPASFQMAGLTVTSSDEDIVKLFENGITYNENSNTYDVAIEATGVGTATLRVSNGSIHTDITVTVSAVAVASEIRLSTYDINLRQTDGFNMAQVRGQVYDTDGNLMNLPVTWNIVGDCLTNPSTNSNEITIRAISVGEGQVVASISTTNGPIYAVADVHVGTAAVSSDEAQGLELSATRIYLSPESPNNEFAAKAIWSPSNLSSQYRNLTWTPTVNGVESTEVVNVIPSDATGENAIIRATGVGTAKITVASESFPAVKAEMYVEVVGDDDTVNVSIDTRTFRLNPGETGNVWADVKINGQTVDASQVEWDIVSGQSVEFEETTGEVLAFTAKNVAGVSVLRARYTYGNKTAEARCVVEVTEMRAEGQHLRSVSFGSESIDINLEGTAAKTVTLQIVPNTIADLDYQFYVEQEREIISLSTASGPSVTVTGLAEGHAKLIAEVSEPGMDPLTAEMTVNVSGASASTEFGSLRLSTSTLNISAYQSPTMISATVTDTGKNDVTEEVANRIRWYITDLDGGNVDTEPSSTGTGKTIRTSYNQTAANMVSGLKPGYKYLWAVVTDDPAADPVTGEGVRAKALVTVKGEVNTVLLDNTYVNLHEGDRITVKASTSPSGAFFDRSVKAYERWEIEFDNGTGKTVYMLGPDNNMHPKSDLTAAAPGLKITLSEPSETEITINAFKEITGNATLRYTYNPGAVASDLLVAESTITVSGIDNSGANIRRLYFDEIFQSIGYNATDVPFRAHIELMDGTEPSDDVYEIRYLIARYAGITAPDNGVPTSELLTIDGLDDYGFRATAVNGVSIFDENLPEGGMDNTGDTNVFVEVNEGNGTCSPVFKAYKDGYVYLNAHGKTDEKIVIMAVVLNAEESAVVAHAKAYISIADSSSAVTLSNDSISIYKGGSLTVEAFADAGSRVEWSVGTIKDATGTAIPNTATAASHLYNELVGFQKLSSSQTTVSATAEGNKVQVFAPFETNNANFLWPATVTLTAKATASNGDVSFRAMTVQINALPEGNTYASAISLSQSKLNLNPPFSTEQTISATVYDGDGNELPAEEVEWTWYKASADLSDPFDEIIIAEGPPVIKKIYMLNTDQVYKDNGNAVHDFVNGYFSSDTHEFFYIPKNSGVYRLTARVKSNTAIKATATINISGSPTGISTDNAYISVSRNGTQVVSAVIAPVGALADKANIYWFMQATSDDGTPQYTKSTFNERGGSSWWNGTAEPQANGTSDDTPLFKEIVSGARVSNTYLRATNNGFSIQLYGIRETADPIAMRVVYTNGDVAYMYDFDVSVVVSKSIHTVAATGLTQVDPSNVEGSQLTYTLNVTNSDGSTFNNWDWLDVQLYGKETGAIYASTSPVRTTLAESHDLYAKDSLETYTNLMEISDSSVLPENRSGWATGEFYYNTANRLTTGSGGRLTLVDNTFSFSLDKSGYPIEPLVLVVKLADGSTTIQAQNTNGFAEYRNGKVAYSSEYEIASADLNYAADNSGKEGWVRAGSALANGYDPQADVMNSKRLEVAIGGRVQGLSIDEIQVMSNGTKVDSTLKADTVTLAEGAGAIINVLYTPSYTHQKEIVWDIYAQSADSDHSHPILTPLRQVGTGDWEGRGMTYKESDFVNSREIMNVSIGINSVGNTITVSAGKVKGNDTIQTYVLKGHSVDEPDVTVELVVQIQSQVKGIAFTAYAAYDKNKNTKGMAQQPQYVIFQDTSKFPPTESTDTILCYDTLDSSSATANSIDAYYVEMKPYPDYGYKFQAEIISGKTLGTITTLDVDEDTNAFYFVPTGRVYSSYDEDGRGVGSFTSNYGDVTVRVYNDEINYSKTFLLTYGESKKRVVGIPNYGTKYSSSGTNPQGALTELLSTDDWKSYMDWYSDGTRTWVKGLEQVILYPEEKFAIASVDFASEGANAGVPIRSSRVSHIDWAIYNGSNTNSSAMLAGTDAKTPGITLDMTKTRDPQLTFPNGQRNDEITAIADTVVISFENQGAYYLSYTITQESDDTFWNNDRKRLEYSHNVISGGLWIYVVDPIDQITAALYQAYTEAGVTKYVRYVSNSQKNHWFGYNYPNGTRADNYLKGGIDNVPTYDGIFEEVYDINGSIIDTTGNHSLKRGTAYISLSNDESNHGLKASDTTSIKTMGLFSTLEGVTDASRKMDLSLADAYLRMWEEKDSNGTVLFTPTIANVKLSSLRSSLGAKFTEIYLGSVENKFSPYLVYKNVTNELKNYVEKNSEKYNAHLARFLANNSDSGSLDLSNFTRLGTIEFYGMDSDASTKLGTINLTGLSSTLKTLKVIQCGWNHSGSGLPFTGGSGLETIDLSNNSFADLSFSGFTSLKDFTVNDCENLTTLSLNGATSVQTVQVVRTTGDSALSSCTFSNLPKLTSLNVSGCGNSASGSTLFIKGCGSSSFKTRVDARPCRFKIVEISDSSVLDSFITNNEPGTRGINLRGSNAPVDKAINLSSDVASNSSSISEFYVGKSLTSTAQIGTIYLSKLSSLTKLQIFGSSGTVYADRCLNLTDVSGNGVVQNLLLAGNTGLDSSDLDGIRVTNSLDISSCTNITGNLNENNNIVLSLTKDGAKAKFFHADNHRIESLNLTNCQLYVIDMPGAENNKTLKKAWVADAEKLEYLDMKNGLLGEAGAGQLQQVNYSYHSATEYLCHEDYNQAAEDGTTYGSSLYQEGKSYSGGTITSVSVQEISGSVHCARHLDHYEQHWKENWVTCPNCKGLGLRWVDTACSYCGGDGETSCSHCGGSGSDYVTCSNCGGKGHDYTCPRCGGSGTSSTSSTGRCPNCGGDGKCQGTCGTCNGTGEVRDGECSYCRGSGSEPCDYCDGHGYTQQQVACSCNNGQIDDGEWVDDPVYRTCDSYYQINITYKTPHTSWWIFTSGLTTASYYNDSSNCLIIGSGSLGCYICSEYIDPSAGSETTGMLKLKAIGDKVDLSGNHLKTKTYSVYAEQDYVGGLFALRQWTGNTASINSDTFFYSKGNPSGSGCAPEYSDYTTHSHNAGHRPTVTFESVSSTEFRYKLSERIDNSTIACGGCDGGWATGSLYFYPFGI